MSYTIGHVPDVYSDDIRAFARVCFPGTGGGAAVSEWFDCAGQIGPLPFGYEDQEILSRINLKVVDVDAKIGYHPGWFVRGFRLHGDSLILCLVISPRKFPKEQSARAPMIFRARSAWTEERK